MQGEPCVETPCERTFPKACLAHLVPVQVCSGNLQALGGCKNCTEVTADWEGEGRTSLPRDSGTRKAGAVSASRGV